MTKLPKRLEKMKTELVAGIDDCCGTSDIYLAAGKAFDAAALEVLREAQKLVNAIKRASFTIGSEDFENVRVATINDLNDALSDWQRFTGEME
jgi:hypothetical protein